MLTTDNWILVKIGRTGPIAKTVQYLLRANGQQVTVDGVVGNQTDAAIRAFQRSHNLTVDGIVGNQTWPVLIVKVGTGAKGDAVRAAQDQLRLRNLGATKNLAVDGDFGPLTDAGVRAFQKALNDEHYLTTPVDGVVGTDTWFALANNFAGPDV